MAFAKRILVYHKPCLTCAFGDWHLVRNWATQQGIVLKERRTEYNPLWHQEATRVWGSEMYPPFLTDADGRNYITVEYALEKIKKKEDDDLLELFGAKNTTRKSRKVVASKKTRKKTRKEAK